MVFDPAIVSAYECAVRDLGGRPPPAPQPALPSITVRFCKSWSNFMSGDLAGFSAEQAQKLQEAGIAELVATRRQPLSLIGA